ncbi:Zinc-regulated transporter 3 [Nakaseomyces glabratus]|nr:Zinc-regulated transporter 3 [Nakaseomyces glabratus]KTB26038.1 Zinc-regulated transporter 3 [Nakaseomyces glabratus]
MIARWLLFSLISSLLCILGALFVPIISRYSSKSHENNNTKLVNYGLSLSAGSMMTTALYKMLPAMDPDNRFTVFFGFTFGILISFFLNYVVHAFTSESLIHCAHGDDHSHSHGDHDHAHDHDHDHNDSHEYGHGHEHSHEHGNNNNHVHLDDNEADDDLYDPLSRHRSVETEHSALLPHGKEGVRRRLSLLDLFSKKHRDIGPCCDSIVKSCGVLSVPADKLTCVPLNQRGKCLNEQCHNYMQEVDQRPNHVSSQTDSSYSPNHSNSSSYESQDDAEHKHEHTSGVVCLENNIGYDLENLDTYRNNYMLGRRNTIEYQPSAKVSTNAGSTSVRSQAISRPSLKGINSAPHYSENAQTTKASNHDGHGHDDGHEHFHHHDEEALYSHHHHLETPFSKLLSIGLQTCLVLTLHKFPEGLIIFYTNQSDETKSLGLSIFISLLIHNFVEGFAMTLPFYTAFESKWKAILITTILGGGSQPFGAILGYFIFKSSGGDHKHSDGAPPIMGLLLSITAGFLVVISVQMFQTGVSFSDSHHHHSDDNEEEIAQNHTMGTTCLKWCCAGICLILLSGIFV